MFFIKYYEYKLQKYHLPGHVFLKFFTFNIIMQHAGSIADRITMAKDRILSFSNILSPADYILR